MRAIDSVKKVSTVDLVKHGKWLHDSDRPDRLICSVCDAGFDMWYYEPKDLPYCPHCGTKMDNNISRHQQDKPNLHTIYISKEY